MSRKFGFGNNVQTKILEHKPLILIKVTLFETCMTLIDQV